MKTQNAIAVVCTVLLLAISALTFFYVNHRCRFPRAGVAKSEIPLLQDQIAASPQNPARPMDVEGVRDPQLLPAEKAQLTDDEIVIGVVAFGEARAYLRSSFDREPEKHVVHDSYGAVPVTVTHCDRTRCTRVFTSLKEWRLDIRCGGWLPQQEMALRLGTKEYSQSSKDIPLDELPFTVTTWKKWQSAHPHSVVYVGHLTKGNPNSS